MIRPAALALGLALCLPTAAVAPVDHCATLLGSLGVELRHARQAPAGSRGSFTCPRDLSVLRSATRQRVLAALGPPDATASGSEGSAMAWTYAFGPRPWGGQSRPPGEPELVFEFDARFDVVQVDCRRRR